MGNRSKTTFDDAKSVLKALLDHGFPSMFAGGCVRDRLLGVSPKDYDIASTAHPEQARIIFSTLGFRVIPTGIEHGTVTVVTTSGPVEITTLRKDVKTDGRHAEVHFEGATFEDDAARRDFTINAMFEDLNGPIKDYHGGESDLKGKRLRFVGDPVQRIREDYLRILRFFRFWARLGFIADEKALDAIKSECQGLTRISQERITNELWEICSARYSTDALIAMENTGVTKVVFPEAVSIDHKTKIILLDASNTNEGIRPWVILIVLLGIIHNRKLSQEEVHKFARKLRLSEKDAHTLMAIFQGWQLLPAIDREIATALDFAETLEQHDANRELLNFYGPIWHFLARHERNLAVQEMLGWVIATDQTYQERRKIALPVNGRDIMEIHPTLQGRSIGNVMTDVRKAFRNGQWQTRHDGLEYLRGIKPEHGLDSQIAKDIAKT